MMNATLTMKNEGQAVISTLFIATLGALMAFTSLSVAIYLPAMAKDGHNRQDKTVVLY